MWARMPVAIVGGIITVYATQAVMGRGQAITSLVWGGVVFLALAVLTLYFAFFHQKTGEVLIDTENEMRKVVWPSREEVSGSTTVVIATTVLLAVAIYGLDNALVGVMKLVGLY